jgi:predicted exporter
MEFEYTKLVGLLSILGTVLGVIMVGSLYPSNVPLAALFALIGIGSMILFVAFLYNYLKYGIYVMPAENFEDEENKE